MKSEGNEGSGFIEVNQSGGLRKAETKAKSRTEKQEPARDDGHAQVPAYTQQAFISGLKPVWYVYKVGA